MIFKLLQTQDEMLQVQYDKSMKELSSFFNLNWIHNQPKLFIVPDRKTIDSLRGQKTKDWVVGWSTSGSVYLLSKDNYETQSCHSYSDKKYFALLKHELAHSFFNVIAQTSYPLWLNDGVSIFISGQLEFKKRPPKLNRFLNSTTNYQEGMYEESGFAVEFLVEKFGKEKLLDLIKNLKDIKSDQEMNVLFKSIYCFDLSYENFEVL